MLVALFLVINLIVDIIYAFVDPRIRLGQWVKQNSEGEYIMKFRELFWHRPMFRTKAGREGSVFTVPMAIALGVLVLVILCCIFAPMISPYSPTEQNLSQALAQPGGGTFAGNR